MNVIDPQTVGISRSGLSRIDDHLTRYIEAGKLAGTLTLIARRGQLAYCAPLGSMDRERDKKMRPDALFRIFSMTKPITSVAMMMLHERALFALGDPVHKWIPEFEQLRVFRQGRHPNFVTEPTQRPMTVRDLMTHQSGLTYSFMERTGVDAAYRRLKIDGRYQGTLQTWVKELATLPLEFSPGEHWNYSVSTDVLGYLVEVISGQRFDIFLRKNIFEPLGMGDTFFSVPEDKIERFTANYALGKDRKIALLDDPVDSPYSRPTAFFSGGGGLVSTASDYLRFAEMLRRGGELDGVRLLGPRTVAYMRQNHLPGGADLEAYGRPLFSETTFTGVGFGLGFSVAVDPVALKVPSSAGEFGWGGAASTFFSIDPVEDTVALFLTQLLPSSAHPIRSNLRALVHQALID
jgi:CubicO group peptidase (beta-lactamase class C family)